MKIAGQTMGLQHGEVTLWRNGKRIPLTVQALPYGYIDQVESELPDPPAPVEFVRGKGGAVLRDEAGEPIERRKTQDPAWRRECMHMSALRTLAVVVKGLEVDPDFVIETPREKLSMREWLEKVEVEIRDAGITDAEVNRIHSKIAELCRNLPQAVDKAAERFLPEAAEAEGGNSPKTPAAARTT